MIRQSIPFGRILKRNMDVFIPHSVSDGSRERRREIPLEFLDEERTRFRVFRDHLKYVLQSNLEKLRTFQLEMNEFADWTLQEFKDWKTGLINADNSRRAFDMDDDDEDSEEAIRRSLKKLYRHHLRRMKRGLHRRRLNEKRFFFDWFSNLFNRHRHNGGNQTSNVFDWRTKSAVSSVKNQLKCGCCYAFATATILETLYAMKTNSQTVIDFSPQQIADCSSGGNNGCHGGNFPPSVRYLMGQGGRIATEASYPYAGQKQSCRTDNLNLINLGNIEYNPLPEGDETKIAEALTTHGPIFIGIDADTRSFMFYRAGVLKINNCPTRRQDMDHAMVIVGYGYDNIVRSPYWIIKNSWGTKWGENGYLRLAKDSGNMCGVASMAYYGKLT